MHFQPVYPFLFLNAIVFITKCTSFGIQHLLKVAIMLGKGWVYGCIWISPCCKSSWFCLFWWILVCFLPNCHGIAEEKEVRVLLYPLLGAMIQSFKSLVQYIRGENTSGKQMDRQNLLCSQFWSNFAVLFKLLKCFYI